MTSKTVWSYVKDSDGRLYIIQRPPEQLMKCSGQWMVKREFSDGTRDWYEVRPNTLTLYNDVLKIVDLNEIPMPSWEDEYPIALNLNVSLSYYVIE